MIMTNKIFKSLLSVILISQMSFLSANLLAAEKIKIDIVSDVVCPWCAVGYKRLSTAIEELDMKDKVEVVWHPFELNPTMPKEGKNADKYLMAKLGLNEEQLKLKRKSVTKTGEESGFDFNYFREMRKPNTFNAHILLDYAKEFNKQTELKVRLQEAYFGEGKNIGNKDVLYAELKTVGLNADEAILRLDNEQSIERVKKEEKYWKDRGVYGVPTMVFDNKIIRRGANQVDVYKQLLTHLANEKK